MSLSPISRVFRLFVPNVASSPAPRAPPPIDTFETARTTDTQPQREAAFEQGRVLGAAAAERGEDCPVFPDLESAADPALISELQRGAQEAYAEGVEAQRQACFDSGFEVGLAGQPGLEGPSADLVLDPVRHGTDGFFAAVLRRATPAAPDAPVRHG